MPNLIIGSRYSCFPFGWFILVWKNCHYQKIFKIFNINISFASVYLCLSFYVFKYLCCFSISFISFSRNVKILKYLILSEILRTYFQFLLFMKKYIEFYVSFHPYFHLNLFKILFQLVQWICNFKIFILFIKKFFLF